MKLEKVDFEKIREFMRELYGIDLTKKYELVKNRLSKFAKEQNYSDLQTLVDEILVNPSMLEELVNRLTTNYTYFMRESKTFLMMSELLIPEMKKDKILKNHLKIWSAGCSSGDETYSVAISLEEMKKDFDYSIYGTDISTEMLEFANKGEYKSESLKLINKSIMSKYFDMLENDNFRVKSTLAANIYFSQINLMLPWKSYYSRFHIIFCRNVMIYFPIDVQNRLIEKFYNSLLPGGYLIVGNSEIGPTKHEKFKYMYQSIYKKEI